MRARVAAIAGLFAALQVPWLTRPPHYDETNFLTLAKGAAFDPWRPHDIAINWQGTTERAFDVLSNPPGIAWWLAPWLDAPIWALRLVMLPWLLVAAWGAWRLGERFLGDGARGALVLLGSPIAILSSSALLPDAPLYALTLAGVGGFVHALDRDRPTLGWAIIAGVAALFRYSAICITPLLALYALLRQRSPWTALGACVPVILLAIHDVSAYGSVHLLAMGSFQSVANTPADLYHKCVAALCMLGGAGIIPMYRWGMQGMLTAGLGVLAAVAWGPVAAVFGGFGGAALAGGKGRDAWFLRAWALGGLLFLLTLRFTATRYWLPFLPGVALALPVGAPMILGQIAVGIGLAWDDAESARAQESLAEAVTRRVADGQFTGHWGWQWGMQARGWDALDAGRTATGAVAIPTEAWPQPVVADCTDAWSVTAEATHPLPRGYSREGRANLHANWIAPDIRTVIPWTIATDPYEVVRVCAGRAAP